MNAKSTRIRQRLLLFALSVAVALFAVGKLRPTPDYGPLFVVENLDYSIEVYLAMGTLHVTDECAFLEIEEGYSEWGGELGSGTYLLAWPDNQVRWIPQSRTIEHGTVGRSSTTNQFRDGDVLSVGSLSRPSARHFEPVSVVDPAACPVTGSEVFHVDVAIHGELSPLAPPAR